MISIEDFSYHFREYWKEIRTAILGGNYTPKPILRVEIEKPNEGIRKPGIPPANLYGNHKNFGQKFDPGQRAP